MSSDMRRHGSRTRLPRSVVLPAAAVAFALGLSGCTVEAHSSSSSSDAKVVDPDAPVRVSVITHGDAGGFWSTVRRGAEDAAKLGNVQLNYQGSAGDAKAQAEMIDAAIIGGAQAIAVSAPDVGAIKASLEKAAAARIPIVTLNSGAALAASNPAIMTHVGQSEEIAGEGAGKKLLSLGAKKIICILHEQNNIGLQERCGGAEKSVKAGGGELVKVQVTGKADPSSTAREIGAAITTNKPDAVLTLDPDIATAAIGQTKKLNVKLATFDLSPDVIKAVQAGEVEFAVDQQPYLQGYLPVQFLAVAVRNGNEVDHGGIVLTGPSFVTKDNADQVAALAARGTR